MLKPSTFASVFSVSSLKSTSALLLALCGLVFVAFPVTSFSQTSNTISKPQLIPNARRYKESSLKPANGRSGSASLTGRALLDKDGVTTIEMSTGQLDTDG